MQKHGIAELVIAPQGRVMCGMHGSPHQNIFFEFADLVKNFRRRHFDDRIAPTPQPKAKFDIHIVHKKAFVKISRNFESPWGKKAARCNHKVHFPQDRIRRRRRFAGAAHKYSARTGDHHFFGLGMAFPNLQHFIHHVRGRQAVLVESDHPTTTTLLR